MRVLHLIQRFPPAIGGAEQWCHGATQYLIRRGHSVDVLALRVAQEGALWGLPDSPGHVAVGAVDLYPGLHVRRCAPGQTPQGLRRLLDRFGGRLAGRYSAELFGRALRAARRADVVHLHHHTVVLSLWGFLAARMTGRPAVITSHVHWGDPSSEQPLGWWLLRHCDAAIAVTQYEADRYASGGVPREKIVISTNAVDIDSFEAASLEKRRVEVRERLCIGRDERVVTFIGRKTLTKDLPVLLEAAQHVARSRGIVLLLLGPRSQEWTPPASVSNGSKLRVIDLPAVPEGAKMAALAASDVVVQPSWREAFGIVFLEAWASGVPPIGAQWGAIPEVIGDAGLTFEKGNALDLASKLDWILDHPHEARDMVARGQERLRNTHTWDCVGRAVEQAYEIARRRHGGPRDIGAKRPPRSESTAGRHPVASSESAHAERRDRR